MRYIFMYNMHCNIHVFAPGKQYLFSSKSLYPIQPGPDAICCQGDMKFFPQKAEPSPGRPWAKRPWTWWVNMEKNECFFFRKKKWRKHRIKNGFTKLLWPMYSLTFFFLWDLLTYQFFFFRKVRVYHAKSIYIFFCQDHLQVQDLDMSTFEPLSVSCLAVGAFPNPLFCDKPEVTSDWTLDKDIQKERIQQLGFMMTRKVWLWRSLKDVYPVAMLRDSSMAGRVCIMTTELMAEMIDGSNILRR